MVAWVVVVLWFGVATLLVAVLVAWMTRSGGLLIIDPKRFAKHRLVEAALLTLIASLWFDSLGSGQWWLLFLLIGALVTISTYHARYTPPNEMLRNSRIVEAICDLVRYVVAGALLAWRLS